jgi:hypothetical protein
MIGHSSEKCNSLLGEARRSAAHYSYQLSKVSLLTVGVSKFSQCMCGGVLSDIVHASHIFNMLNNFVHE